MDPTLFFLWLWTVFHACTHRAVPGPNQVCIQTSSRTGKLREWQTSRKSIDKVAHWLNSVTVRTSDLRSRGHWFCS